MKLTRDAFCDLRHKAQQALRRSKETPSVLICAGTGCIAGGALKIYENLKNECESRDLPVYIGLKHDSDEEKSLHIKMSGCHGFCEMGPLVHIEPMGIMYIHVKPEDCHEILEKTVLGGEIIDRLVYRLNGVAYPRQEDIPFYKKQHRVVLENCGTSDAQDIEEYIAKGGYSGFERALFEMTDEQICRDIIDSGLRGRGGAGFPTHVKISSAVGKADTIIVNGAECEPYITADHRLMLEHGEKIIGGVRFIMKALQLDHAFIGIEDNKMNAVNHLKELVGDAKDITVQALRTRYPQGAEKQLIQAITGREVPPGKLPADVGCCVFNAATTAAIYDAVALGQPVYQRVITITGSAVKNPVNLLAPVGTPFSHLIEEAGGFNGTPARVISGGPMMGFAQYDMSVTMGKASNCVLCLSKEDMPAVSANPTCIRCARCVNVCPMHLTPLFMNMFAKARRWSEVEEYRIMDCMECGSCQYICPARIPLVQQFRTAKFAIRQQAAKK